MSKYYFSFGNAILIACHGNCRLTSANYVGHLFTGMSTFDIDWASNPCVLVTGGSIKAMRATIDAKVNASGYPVWEIRSGDTDEKMLKTIEALADHSSDQKILIFDGNTNVFARRGGQEMIANYFWYPNFLETRTVLIILVEDVQHPDFYIPLLTSKYHMDIRHGEAVRESD